MTPAREAFEAWYTTTHTTAPILRTRKGYTSEVTRVAWRAWQAAMGAERERLAQEFDRRAVYADGTPSTGWYEPSEPAEIIRGL